MFTKSASQKYFCCKELSLKLSLKAKTPERFGSHPVPSDPIDF